MNVFILTDVEGLPGIDRISCVFRERESFMLTRQILTDTINLAARICRQNGADKIYYLDGHAGGGNVLADAVLPFVEQVDLAGWQALIKSKKIDCQLELGCHSRAGTTGGFLDHTLNSRQNFCLKINGREFSELAIHAAFCGAYDVPVVFCSGDEAACRQAKEYVPEIVTAPVKKATKRNYCILYDHPASLLTAGIAQALKNYRQIPPMKISLPAEVALTYYRSDYCEEALEDLGQSVIRTDARTLKKAIGAIENYKDLCI